MTFFNIFSKKPLKNKEKIKILVDNREKNSLLPSELSKLNFQIEFQQLPVADYVINNTLAIERKTVSDLKSSIINKRIFSQLKEIKQFPKHLLLVEGSREELFNNQILHNNSIRGFILSVQLDYSIPLLFSENEKESAILISILSNKKVNSSPSLRPSKIPLTKKEQQQFILEGFPGIGPKTAEKLLDKFSSLKNIFSATEFDLKEILGPKTSKFIDMMN
jgi:ERCC4-type nuclease